MIEKSIENEKKGANARAGSYAVCVRTCDGSFFPVSYSGAGSRADSLEEVCRSLCPNADVALYSFPFGGTIDQAVSVDRRALCRYAQRAQVPAVVRFDLLVPSQGAKAGRRRSPARRPDTATSRTTFW